MKSNNKLSDKEQADKYFWEAIEKYNKENNEYDVEEHLESIINFLADVEKDRLILFEKTMQEKLSELYTAEMAELNIILDCDFKKENDTYIFDDYLSEDGFIYFRCWLLLKGKEFFDDIRLDIQSLVSGKYNFSIGSCEAEGLLYVADEAYSINNENEDDAEIRDTVYELYPENHYDSMEREMNRDFKGGSDLHKMYPKLVKEICELKS